MRAIIRLTLVRFAQAAAALLVAATIAFAVVSAADVPLAVAPGADLTAPEPSAPPAEPYLTYLGHALVGDFGVSGRLARPAGALIMQRLPATLALVWIAFLPALAVGVPAGVLAALRPRAFLTRTALAVALLGVSVPTFIAGTLLILVFAGMLHVLPGSADAADVARWNTGLPTVSGWQGLVLPVATLAIFQAPLLLRLVRAGVRAGLDSEFARFGRARGLPRAVLLHQAGVNALVPLVATVVRQFGLMIALAVVTETVFQWPGAGLLLVQSVIAADAPMIAAYVVLVALLFVVLRIAADLASFAIDPRLRPVRRKPPPAAPLAVRPPPLGMPAAE